MRLTRFGLHGLLFHGALLVAFYAAPYSNLFFLLLGFVTLLGVSGLFAARRNLRGLTASIAELEPVPAGSALRIPTALYAPGPARFQIEARLELAGGQRLSGRVEWLAGAATLDLIAPALPRGCHAVRGAVLESSHPFGLVRVRRAFPAPKELVVYPAPRALREGRSALETLEELLGGGEPGGGDLQPMALRDHREGDGLRDVHWRATARRGRLVVQEWEGGSGQGLEVALDRRCSADELERALTTISALVALARTNKETLRVHSQGLSATYGDGQASWNAALRFLAAAECLPPDAPPPPSTSPAVLRLPVARHAR